MASTANFKNTLTESGWGLDYNKINIIFSNNSVTLDLPYLDNFFESQGSYILSTTPAFVFSSFVNDGVKTSSFVIKPKLNKITFSDSNSTINFSKWLDNYLLNKFDDI